MKRYLLLFMVLGLITGSMSTAEARGSKRAVRTERTVEGSYGPYPSPVTGCNEPLGQWACLTIQTRVGETSFTAKVTDAHGQPVFVQVTGAARGSVYFCGETTQPISFSRGSTLRFHIGVNDWPSLVYPLSTSADCPANRIKTTGTISVTLSNRP